VQTTPSGLQYVVISRGPAGGAQPAQTDYVSVHYEGRRTTGETFDSSYERGMPAEFRLDQVIPGWTEGVQLMREGDEFLFFIPNALAYGNRDVGPVIRAGDNLLFHVALLGVSQPPSADAAAWETYFPWKPDHPDVRRTGSGLEYVILESGPAAIAPPQPEEFVAVNFEARLAASGEIVGSTFEMGQPEVFPAGAVIPGWSEALSLMRPGDRWMLFVPADLAFGDEGGGPIPPGADIVFEYELLDIMR
jgi:peptidylprolyl isomerase